MFIFSVSACSDKAQSGFSAGSKIPFIVYIDFKDLFGAENLCRLYLMQEGFKDISIEKRKMLVKEKLDPALIEKDPAMQEALNIGYMIQMFEAH
jgi:hypothetical protein